MTAISVYTGIVSLLGGSAIFALLAPPRLYEFVAGGVIPVGVARFSNVAVILGIALLVAVWSYRAAARRFRQYTPT